MISTKVVTGANLNSEKEINEPLPAWLVATRKAISKNLAESILVTVVTDVITAPGVVD